MNNQIQDDAKQLAANARKFLTANIQRWKREINKDERMVAYLQGLQVSIHDAQIERRKGAISEKYCRIERLKRLQAQLSSGEFPYVVVSRRDCCDTVRAITDTDLEKVAILRRRIEVNLCTMKMMSATKPFLMQATIDLNAEREAELAKGIGNYIPCLVTKPSRWAYFFKRADDAMLAKLTL